MRNVREPGVQQLHSSAPHTLWLEGRMQVNCSLTGDTSRKVLKTQHANVVVQYGNMHAYPV